MLSKMLIYIGVTLLLIAGMLSLVRKNISPKSAIKNMQTIAKASANPVPKTINANELTNHLDDVTEEYSHLDIGVAVIDLKTNQTFSYGDKAAYYGASTTKVLVAAAYFHEVEIGKRSITQRIDGSSSASLIKAMLEQSDNDAWYSLIGKLRKENIETYARSIGINSYVAKDNLINTQDMALLLQKLYRGELVNKDHKDIILGHMNKSIRNYVSPVLGNSYKVYHKAGWLDDRFMDAAIIEHDDHAYVLVTFSKSYSDNYDFQEGSTLIGEIAKVVDSEINK